jgi:hypothetical protein
MRRLTKAVFVSIGLLAVLSATNFDQKSLAIASPLKDITNHWAESAISDATQKGYVDGYPDQTFKPDGTVSRAEFIKMVASAIGKKVTTEESNIWYLPYVRALQDEGVLSQYFYEDDMGYPMVRSEMAMVSSRAVDKTSDGTMESSVRSGLIGGVGAGELDAQGSTTRAQAVTIIERILALRAGGKVEVDPAAVDMIEIESVGTNFPKYWNLKQVAKFPLEIKYGNGITIRVNKVVYLDYAKGADQPYGYLFDGYQKFIGVDLNDRDTIAFQFDLEVEGTDSPSTIYIRDIFKPDTVVPHGDVVFSNENNITGRLAGFNGGVKKNYSGWLGYSKSKEITKIQFADKGKARPLVMKIGNDSIVIAE